VREDGAVKIVIWHGYLLGGTGSNVYTRSLAQAWRRMGHDVVVICQDPAPDADELLGARVVRPHIGPLLPVFVLDRYEGVEARRVQDMTPSELDRVVEANAAAIRAELPAELVLVNHVLLGAPVGAAAGVPYMLKAHGSELEFSIRASPMLAAWARASLDGARAIIVGSDHIRRVVEEVLGPGPHMERVERVPPGVDIARFRPEPRRQALASLVAEARRDPPPALVPDERRPDPGNAERLEAFLSGDAPTVVYVGKLSREKGVHLLVAALTRLEARAVIAGFGPERARLEEEADGRVLFTGALEHRHLAHLWALADVSVTPSVFPEAFGMVAAEAAACGSPPLVARHSGLAEVATGLEAEYPLEHRGLVSFATGDLEDLTATLQAILALEPTERARLGAAARRAAERLWSWEGVARTLLAHADPPARARGRGGRSPL
jgi:glycosyltransferase involved in cell wall biosynthesis